MSSEFKKFVHHILPDGGVMLADTGKRLDGSIGTYFTLVIKTDNNIVNLIGKDPIIEIVPFLVKLHIADFIIIYFFLLIRFNRNNQILYESSFNLAENSAFSMLETMTKQNKQQIFVMGENQDTTIIVDLAMPNIQIASLLKLVKQTSTLDWTKENYEKCIPIIYDKFDNPIAMWKTFQESGMIIDLHLNMVV